MPRKIRLLSRASRFDLRMPGWPVGAAVLLALGLSAPSASAVPAPASDGESRIVALGSEAGILPLETCLEEALANNAGLRAERIRREELRSQMTQARAIGLPTLDLSGTWSRGRDPSFAFSETFAGGDGGGIGLGGDYSDDVQVLADDLNDLFGGLSFIPSAEDIPAQTYWRTSVNARWELRPGLIYNAVGAAGLGVERQDLIVEGAQQRLEESVMGAYYDVIRAGERLAAIEADMATREELLAVTRRRFMLGLSTALDTLRASVNLANLAPQQRSAARHLENAGAQLNILMGRPALTPLAVQLEQGVEVVELDGDLLVRSLGRRPDIRQSELLELILRKNRGAQKAEHRPYLSADASYGYVTVALDELTDPGHDFWSANISLNIPLFDGWLTSGKVKETEASIRRLEYEIEDARRQARLELMSLAGDLEAARMNLAAAERNLAAAADALDQMTLRYELGKADYLSFLDAETQHLQARSNQIEARNDVLTLTAALKRALGFSPSMSLTEIEAVLGAEPGAQSAAGE